MKRLLLVLLAPGLIFAASPEPAAPPAAAATPAPAATPDPLAAAFDTYEATINQDLAQLYRTYEELTQPGKDVPMLPRYEASLERVREIDVLGALPAEWIKALNELGAKAQAKGEADDLKEPPAEYIAYNPKYAAVEPTGDPIRTPDELAAGMPATPAKELQPPFDTLKTLLKPGLAKDKVEDYKRYAQLVADTFKKRCRVTVVTALRALKPAVEKVRQAAKPVEGRPPWEALGSERVKTRIDHYLAERYYKGRWIVGRKGPQSTSAGTGPSGSGTGDGVPAKPGQTGTGSGDEPKEPASPGTGTGDGSKPVEAPAGMTGTGDGGSASPAGPPSPGN